MSLADPNPTSVDPLGARSNLEIEWNTFAGTYGDVYWALLVQRAHEDGISPTEEALLREFNRHLHRGIGLLANIAQKPTVRDLIARIA